MGCQGGLSGGGVISGVQGAQQGAGGLSGVPGGAQWGARRVGGICGSWERGGHTTNLQAWSTPKNGRALCVSPALSPSLTPWPGCALGLVNPQRPGWGPPRWCELTRWPLDLCYPCVSPPDPLCPMCLAGAWPPLSLPQFPFPAGTGTLATPFPGKLVPASHWGCGGGSGHWPHATSQGCRQVRQ